MTQRVLGSIVSLWRYPVKSMMGQMAPSLVVQSYLDQIFTKMFNRDEIFRVGRGAKGHSGGTGRISKASRKLTYGSFVEYPASGFRR